jgi:hypothetical protein
MYSEGAHVNLFYLCFTIARFGADVLRLVSQPSSTCPMVGRASLASRAPVPVRFLRAMMHDASSFLSNKRHWHRIVHAA